MSLYTHATPRLVASRIKAGQNGKDWAVVDVRAWVQSERYYIPGCHVAPVATLEQNCIHHLLDELRDVKFVVFHCSTSEANALEAVEVYTQMRESALNNAHLGGLESVLPHGPEARANQSAQEVVVLQGGIDAWAEKFKDDPVLVGEVEGLGQRPLDVHFINTF